MSTVNDAPVETWWARLLVPAIVPALLVAGYQWYATRAGSPYFPSLGEITDAVRQLWFGPGFSRDVVPSLTNLFAGYAVGLVLGVAVGVVIGRVATVRHLLQPVISFGLTLPPVAVLPIFLIVFGVGPSMHRGIIAFAVFFVAVINTAIGISTLDPVLDDVAAVYRLSRARRILQVVIPAASVNILAAARVGLNSALLVMVVGEMIGASRGIGAATLLAQQTFAYDRMWAGIVLLAALGIVLNLGFLAFERRLVRRLGLADSTTGGN